MIVDAKTYGDIYSALAFSRTIIIRANGEVHCGRMSSIKHTDEGTIVRFGRDKKILVKYDENQKIIP